MASNIFIYGCISRGALLLSVGLFILGAGFALSGLFDVNPVLQFTVVLILSDKGQWNEITKEA